MRSELLRTWGAALLVAAIAVQGPGVAAAAAPIPLPVAAVLVDGAQTSLVVDLSASTHARAPSATVTHDGTPQKATVVPVVSDGLAVTLVVDTSAAGTGSLPAWLSAAARFILEAPATTRAVVIADSAPATAITGPQRGPTDVVRALTSVHAHGRRDTAAALALAARQFPDAPAGQRVIVLYTTGTGAGDQAPATLGARLRAGGTILVVVGTSGGDPYWGAATAATGGFFAPAGNPVVIPALDQVETTLRGRYLVRFPTPPRLPARVSVRVDTGDLTLTGDAVVAATSGAKRSSQGGSPLLTALLGLAGLLLAAALVAVIVVRRRRRTPPAPADPAADQVAEPPVKAAAVPAPPAVEAVEAVRESARVVARGRAAVRGTVARGMVARGRAAVPTNRAAAPINGKEIPPRPPE